MIFRHFVSSFDPNSPSAYRVKSKFSFLLFSLTLTSSFPHRVKPQPGGLPFPLTQEDTSPHGVKFKSCFPLSSLTLTGSFPHRVKPQLGGLPFPLTQLGISSCRVKFKSYFPLSSLTLTGSSPHKVKPSKSNRQIQTGLPTASLPRKPLHCRRCRP